jgi:hypothetical protein
MVKAYFLRNEQRDADGRMAKDSFLPNWRELMDAGKDTNRGYVSGDKLVAVNDKPEVFNSNEDENMTDIEIAETMFSMFNRKDNDPNEREFAGPSMSVGDLVVILGCWSDGKLQNDVTVLQVASCGWKVLNPTITDAKSFFEVLPLPATAILALELSRRA